jgi:hypothetical protein
LQGSFREGYLFGDKNPKPRGEPFASLQTRRGSDCALSGGGSDYRGAVSFNTRLQRRGEPLGARTKLPEASRLKYLQLCYPKTNATAAASRGYASPRVQTCSSRRTASE